VFFSSFVSVQNISDEKFVRLFDALKRNTRLEVLCLANTDMPDRVASKLCDALEKNSTLRVLNVESNFITPPVIRDLIKSLLAQKTLEEFRAVNQVRFMVSKNRKKKSRKVAKILDHASYNGQSSLVRPFCDDFQLAEVSFQLCS
jgi:hypothetical protein